jgi:hypothetical protein
MVFPTSPSVSPRADKSRVLGIGGLFAPGLVFGCYDDPVMRDGMKDTAPAIEALRTEGFRRMSPAQKFALVNALTKNIRQLALTGIRMRNPGIDGHEAMLRLAAMSVDRATLTKAFGWNPERSGT